MHISLEWVGAHVALDDLDPAEVAERLTLATAEVEELVAVRRHVDGVRVAVVRSVEPLDAEASAVTLDVGGGTATVVTTAPEVPPGVRVAYAPPGARLASGEVGAIEVRGRRSEGFVCSPAELGLGDADAVLQFLPDGLAVGSLLSAVLPPADTVVVIDNKSLTHRPDLWGHYGFARELAAIYQRPLRPLDLVAAGDYAGLPQVDVRIESPDCLAYSCVRVDGVAPVPASLTVQRRLAAVGQHCINALVDLSNYVMLELAQPLHAFDSRQVNGLRIARSAEARELAGVDGEKLAVAPEDLLIWDGDRPLALAGVIGGEDSKVVADTAAITLESATFDAVRVRRTQTRLGVRTEAGLRFEKGQPVAMSDVGLRRYVRLLLDEQPGARVTSAVSRAETAGEAARTIAVSAADIGRRMGMDLGAATVTDVLERLGFAVDGDGDDLRVEVPPFRGARDITGPHDILEEVARVVGYGNVPAEPARAAVVPAGVDRTLACSHRVRRLLCAAHRFTEVHTYSWFDDAWLGRLGYDPGATVGLRNPRSPETARLRSTLVPNLLGLVRQNWQHREQGRLVEVGRVFRPGDDGAGQPGHGAGHGAVVERTAVTGVAWTPSRRVATGQALRELRGAVDDVLELLRPAGAVTARVADPSAPWEQPGATVELALDGEAAVRLGTVPGAVARELGKGVQAVWFELDLDRLARREGAGVVFDAPPPYPGSAFDLSLVWDMARGYEDLRALVDAHEDPLIRDRRFVTSYQGEGLAAGQASYTFRFRLQADDHTLTPEETTAARARLIEHLAAGGVALR